MNTFLRTTLITFAAVGLAACGAKGPLFLPEPAEPMLTAPDVLPEDADEVAPTAPMVDMDTPEPAQPVPEAAEEEEETNPPPPPAGDGGPA